MTAPTIIFLSAFTGPFLIVLAREVAVAVCWRMG